MQDWISPFHHVLEGLDASLSLNQEALTEDEQWMGEALKLARHGLGFTAPNPPVGCVIVSKGQVLGKGYHRAAGQPHAEVEAVRDAANAVEGATAYVTLEPCNHQGKTPPCTDLLIEKKIARVVVGTVDPNPRVNGAGLQRLRSAGISVEVLGGSIAQQAAALIAPFREAIFYQRPWITMKLAVSSDGAIAAEPGVRTAITGAGSLAMVHRLRAASDAVLVGANTVRIDDPLLNVRDVREWDYPFQQPLKIILDPQLSLSGRERVFSTENSKVWVCHLPDASNEQKKTLENVGAQCLPIAAQRDTRRLDLKSLFSALAKRDIHSVLVEPGKALFEALARENTFNELFWFVGPDALGKNSVAPDSDLLQNPKVRSWLKAPGFGAVWRHIGEDALAIFPGNT